MTTSRRRPARHTNKALAQLLARHPELRPAKAAGKFQPAIRLTGAKRPADVTPGEREFVRLLKAGHVRFEYEPFELALERKANGQTRSFQPDFWLPELGLIVELCATAHRKNPKVILAHEGWPDLRVLVMTDAEVSQIAKLRPTRWALIEQLVARAAAQDERIEREGRDPKGYSQRPRRRWRAARRVAA